MCKIRKSHPCDLRFGTRVRHVYDVAVHLQTTMKLRSTKRGVAASRVATLVTSPFPRTFAALVPSPLPRTLRSLRLGISGFPHRLVLEVWGKGGATSTPPRGNVCLVSPTVGTCVPTVQGYHVHFEVQKNTLCRPSVAESRARKWPALRERGDRVLLVDILTPPPIYKDEDTDTALQG